MPAYPTHLRGSFLDERAEIIFTVTLHKFGELYQAAGEKTAVMHVLAVVAKIARIMKSKGPSQISANLVNIGRHADSDYKFMHL